MSTESRELETLVNRRYEHGFVTDIAADSLPPGLDEDVIRAISARKKEPEFMLEWRLKAYRHWLTMDEPEWAHVHYPKIDYQSISYFSAPKSDDDRPKFTKPSPPRLGTTRISRFRASRKMRRKSSGLSRTPCHFTCSAISVRSAQNFEF